MKRAAQFSDDGGGITVTMTLERVEDVGPAIDFLTDMASAVWRELVIEDDRIRSYVEANWRSKNGAPEKPRKPRGGAAHDHSKPPDPDKLDGKVLKAVRDLGKIDVIAIADDLDLRNVMVAQALGRLRKGGHLGAFA